MGLVVVVGPTNMTAVQAWMRKDKKKPPRRVAHPEPPLAPASHPLGG